VTTAAFLALATLAAGPRAGQPPDLTGVVRAIDGLPVEGATVVLHGDDQPRATTTGPDGRYEFPNASLPVIVDVRASGFTSVSRMVDASPADFVLEPAAVTESVIVTAGVSAYAPWRDPVTGTTVLSRGDLHQLPAVTTDEALRVISGFSLFRRSSSRASNPTTQGVTLRGLSASGASRGLVLLDGVPLNDGFGGWVTWTRVPPSAIDRVEVDRGPEGDAFGSDALGGLVRILTPTGQQPISLAAVEAGTPGVVGLDGSLGRRRGRLAGFGAASWFRTDGVVPLAPESRGAVDRPADAEWVNGFGRLGMIGERRRLYVLGWGGRDDRGNGTALQRNRMSGGTLAASFDAVGASTIVSSRVSTSPNHFRQTFTSVAAGRATETLVSTQMTDTRTSRATVEMGRSLPFAFGYVLARAAVAHGTADFEDQRRTSTTTRALVDDTRALSAQARFNPANGFTVGVGVRREWRAAPERGDPRDGATVGHVTAAFQIAGPVFLHGSLATSHRWPTLNELVRDFQVGSVVTLANPALRPERARTVDATVAVRARRVDLSIGGFTTVVLDAIANVTLPSLTGIVRQRRNAGETHANGLEIDAEVRAWPSLRLRSSATVVGATFVKSAEPALEGLRLPQVPRVSVSVEADGHLPRDLSLSLVWRATSSQFDDDRNQYELGGASQVDARMAGRRGSIGWEVVLENLFDARIEVGRTPLVTLAPRRAVRVGLSWRN
jgi:outer membrane cobalamin receptor